MDQLLRCFLNKKEIGVSRHLFAKTVKPFMIVTAKLQFISQELVNTAGQISNLMLLLLLLLFICLLFPPLFGK